MDERAASIDAKVRRVGVALAWVVGAAVLYLVLFIAIMSQLRTPTPSWVSSLFWPIPLFAVAIGVLRYRHTWLKGDAALAQAAATSRSFDALEDELNRSRTIGRETGDDRHA